jgi:hypothetical protein
LDCTLRRLEPLLAGRIVQAACLLLWIVASTAFGGGGDFGFLPLVLVIQIAAIVASAVRAAEQDGRLRQGLFLFALSGIVTATGVVLLIRAASHSVLVLD